MAYAKTELAQGNQTSYKYAGFELRKATLLNPQNSEAWLLLAQSLDLVSPTLIERDMRIWGAYEKAIETAADEAAKQRIRSNPDYQALKTKLYRQTSTSGQTFYDIRGYKRTDTTRISPATQDAILKFESKHALFKMALQSCGPQTPDSACETRIDEFNNAYRQAYVDLKNANLKTVGKTSTMGGDISDGIIDNLKAEAKAYNDKLIPCVRQGQGNVEQCWEKTFPNLASNKNAIETQDWRDTDSELVHSLNQFF